MIQVNIAAISNQSLSIRLENRLYVLTLKETRGVMSMDIMRDGETVVQGQRLVAGSPVIGYPYRATGNFVFITLDEEYPDWRQFGAGQFLLYATAAEVLQSQEQFDLTVAQFINDGLPVLPAYFFSVWDGGASIWDGGATNWRDLSND